MFLASAYWVQTTKRYINIYIRKIETQTSYIFTHTHIYTYIYILIQTLSSTVLTYVSSKSKLNDCLLGGCVERWGGGGRGAKVFAPVQDESKSTS